MRTKPCRFCEELRAAKNRTAGEFGTNAYIKWNAALEESRYIDSIYLGTTTYRNHKLNYCPECGRNIRKVMRK